MKKIAEFEKVSFNQFLTTMGNIFNNCSDEKIKEIYGNIKLPERATRGSAGYDFFAPFDIELSPGETITVPTGIRAKIATGWLLSCYPRSGLCFKYRLQLDNTVGIIDSDYYLSDNEGHILAKITNNSLEGKTLSVKCGEGFMQGIFLEFGITIDDDCKGVRNGGFGSTTRRDKN